MGDESVWNRHLKLESAWLKRDTTHFLQEDELLPVSPLKVLVLQPATAEQGLSQLGLSLSDLISCPEKGAGLSPPALMGSALQCTPSATEAGPSSTSV